MKRVVLLAVGLGLMAALGLVTGCSGQGGPAAARSPQQGRSASSGPSASGASRANSVHMASPAAYKVADVQYADRMNAYVNGALTLSAQAQGRTTDPVILEFAKGMAVELGGSHQQLTDWFAQWGSKSSAGSAAALRGWAGIPTSASERGLAAESGITFERAYLRLIIADQQGMLSASTLEQEGGAFGPARQLADQIVSSSTLAIVRVNQMLKLLK